MNKNTWIVWALFLLLPGAVGLSIHFALKDSLESRIAQAAEQSTRNPAADEYLQMYEQWSNLPADQKADNPWGHGAYGGLEIQSRMEEGQTDRLIADLPTLEKGVTHYPDQLADVVYGLGWQQVVDDYRQERAAAEIVLIASTFLLASGGLIVAGGLVKLLVWRVFKKRPAQDGDDDADRIEETLQDASKTKPSPPPLLRSVSEPQASAETPAVSPDEEPQEIAKKGYFGSTKMAGSLPVDPKTSGPWPMAPKGSKSARTPKPQKDSYFGWSVDEEDSTDFETLMTTEPLTRELTELTEEVSAIRQYAVQQQDQMRKLQDGYDWMIIRRFCLRIIRCIDNIEDRMTHLETPEPMVSECLEDIRDELVFALESSGVEQFKPDLTMSFKGLEKYAEAVRERVFTDDANRVGCIAEVTRPGYQYLVNDDTVKIVRCAQVKLYEANTLIGQ